MPIQKCSRPAFAAKIRDVRRLRSKVPADLRPLFNHLLKLSLDSVKRGYCQRAGQEIAYARKLYQKHGIGLSGSAAARKRHGVRVRSDGSWEHPVGGRVPESVRENQKWYEKGYSDCRSKSRVKRGKKPRRKGR